MHHPSDASDASRPEGAAGAVGAARGPGAPGTIEPVSAVGTIGAVGAIGIDEEVLLAALRAGEDWAYEALVRAFGGRLIAVARRICGNDEDARDIVQSAYLSALQSLDRFKGSARVSTWLYRIVVNMALTRLRTRRRKPEESIEEHGGYSGRTCSDWTLPADRQIEREQTRHWVRACIDVLPAKHREVLILRDIEELSTKRVAVLLEMTPAAVKIRVYRARQALSKVMDARPKGTRHIRRSLS